MAGTYCIIDRNEIPDEREHRKAVTCSDECQKQLKEHRRKRKDLKVCRVCSKPSTPEERVLFQRWRRETFPIPKIGRPSKKPKPDADGMLGASTNQGPKPETSIEQISESDANRMLEASTEKPMTETEIDRSWEEI